MAGSKILSGAPSGGKRKVGHKMSSIRRVDLQDDFRSSPTGPPSWGRELLAGLQENGFVRIAGHPVSSALISRAQSAFQRFFDLSRSEKSLTGGIAGGQRGYTPLGLEQARNHDCPDEKEFFHVGQDVPPSTALSEHYVENIWPKAVPELRASALALYRELENTAKILLQGLALACELPLNTFSQMIENGNSILRAVHYPPLSANAKPGTMRAAPHEDINLITLLCGETDAGLEILNRDTQWIPVTSEQGEIVADVGDMLARMTNNRLLATTHRVVARGPEREKSRYALPFFAHPRPDCDLSVLKTFLSNGESPLFPSIHAADFLETRLKEIGLL